MVVTIRCWNDDAKARRIALSNIYTQVLELNVCRHHLACISTDAPLQSSTEAGPEIALGFNSMELQGGSSNSLPARHVEHGEVAPMIGDMMYATQKLHPMQSMRYPNATPTWAIRGIQRTEFLHHPDGYFCPISQCDS